jgi:predicted alpha/beta superfamily hydrolase
LNLSVWQNYVESKPEHTVIGTVLVHNDLYSPQLGNSRDIFVYLPPSYERENKHYPVIYMHDGQNLFDEHASFAGEWCVDETIQALFDENIESIVVGIPNIGDERLNEYSPFPHPRLGGGRGHQYIDFITDTIKPLIDTTFRTSPDREHTGIMGSSMGGLISLYAFFSHADTFGFAGVMSPAFWFGRRAIYDYVTYAPFVPGKIYLDIGTNEVRGRRSSLYTNYVAEMYALLIEKGYGENVRYIEENDGQHHEPAWARRLPDALRFLLRP